MTTDPANDTDTVASAADHGAALDLASRGEWDAAHRCVQNHEDALSCAIHAWLHRVEGDQSNAAYWYRRAGQTPCELTLEDECAALRERVQGSVAS